MWTWETASMSTPISIKDVRENRMLPWDWGSLSYNPNIDIDFVIERNERWNWFALSGNPGITMRDILRYPNESWNPHAVSWNPNFEMSVLQREGGALGRQAVFCTDNPMPYVVKLLHSLRIFVRMWRRDKARRRLRRFFCEVMYRPGGAVYRVAERRFYSMST
jgi:hypothetical protein